MSLAAESLPPSFDDSSKDDVLAWFASSALAALPKRQSTIPALAKDRQLTDEIAAVLPQLPTWHRFHQADATRLEHSESGRVHLVLCSPPYWTLKRYRECDGQLGHLDDYEAFLAELDMVWSQCYAMLAPGGRLICVVGDVCLSRRKNNGRHVVIPLHASIQEHCRRIGYDNLTPIIWHKIANAAYEVGKGGSSFLGKPFEPNAVVKNDIEFILMQRKPGGYRKPGFLERCFSVIGVEEHRRWFRSIWSDVTGASTRNHPAPYPLELATRLIRMFSFVGDTVYDPFLGTGTTSVAAALTGRNSIGVEIDAQYLREAMRRFEREAGGLLSGARIKDSK